MNPFQSEPRQSDDVRRDWSVPVLEPDLQPACPAHAIGSTTWPGLAKLLEEVGELSQVIGKIVAYPDGHHHPDGGPPLVVRLENELADVLAAIRYVRAHTVLDRKRIEARVEAKFERFQRWDGEERNRAAT